MVVNITIDSRKVQNMITGYRRTIPQAAQKGIEKLAKKGVENLKQSAAQAGIKPWGKGEERSIFRGGIFARKKDTQWRIHVASHGVNLDQMRPHWVALKRTRDITKWALERGVAETAGRGRRPRVLLYLPFETSNVFVHRRPFIAKGVTQTIKDAKKIPQREIKKAVNRKGR